MLLKRSTVVFALLTFAIHYLSSSQVLQGKITYEATIVDSYLTNLVIMPPHLKNLELKAGKDAVPVNFHLYFDGTESLYQAEHDVMETKRLGLLMNQTNIVGRHHYIYYTNLQNGEKYYQNHKVQHILVNMEDLDWKLTKETKKIGKYTCYKATATVEAEQTHGMNFLNPVEAWYTNEIPVPFGIQTFVGLPGLTLELTADYENAKIHYYATEIELNPEEKINIEKPEAKLRMSEQEYVEKIKELNERRKKY